MKNINVKYFNEDMKMLKKTVKGDWIDMRCVDAKLVNINNVIEDSENGTMLMRETIKTPVIWEDGQFLNDDGMFEEVKFFRYKKGDFLLLDLGVAMELPQGYEANVVPRSSSFKNFTIVQTNSLGVVDESYKGDTDKWFMPVLAMQDGFIMFDERVCQFRIQKKMEKVKLTPVDKLDNDNRGGHGSSGTR